MNEKTITVGELKSHLEHLNDDDELELPGGLTFYRIKQRGDDFYVLEVNEPFAYLSPSFKKKNPHVKVAFINTDDVEWDESGITGGPVDVEIK